MTVAQESVLDVSEAVRIGRRVFADHRVTFVCTLYGSTGSFFLYSLLDNHPDLYTFPYDIRRAPVDLEDFDARPRAAHVRALLEDNERLFDTARDRSFTNSLQYLGDGRDAGLVIDRERFAAYLDALLDVADFSPRTFTLAVVLAYNFARNVVPRSSRVVLYTHDLIRTVRLWKRAIPDAGIVAACRHPVNVFASYCARKRFESADRARLPAPYALTEIESFPDLTTLLAAAGDVRLLLIEELHARPESSMRALAADLGVPFTDTLLQSSIGGLRWWGSHQRVGTINGFSRELHRTLASEAIGARAERMIWRSTARFQRHAGYASVGPARASAVTARWPRIAVTYYRDLARAAAALIRAAGTARARFGVVRRAANAAAHYALVWWRERAAVRELARRDAGADYSPVRIVNPLSADSLCRPGPGADGGASS